MFRCNICGQVSGSRRSQAEEHSETHILGLRFPCRVCRRVVTSQAAMRRHLQQEHSGPATVI